eukprot:6051591-Amphidinium_carterae.1
MTVFFPYCQNLSQVLKLSEFCPRCPRCPRCPSCPSRPSRPSRPSCSSRSRCPSCPGCPSCPSRGSRVWGFGSLGVQDPQELMLTLPTTGEMFKVFGKSASNWRNVQMFNPLGVSLDIDPHMSKESRTGMNI